MSSNILLLSKLETQQFVGDKSEYFLDEQIRRCILVLEKQWMDKEIELNIDLPELRYTNNEEMMSHVWLNIIGNAIKFSNTGGKIDIKGVLNEDVIEISIKDEGVGMSKDVLNKAFNKFWQADSSEPLRETAWDCLVKKL